MVNVLWMQLWKADWQFLERLNIELPCDLAIPLLDIHLIELKMYVHTKNLHTNIEDNLIHNSQKVETTQMPIN